MNEEQAQNYLDNIQTLEITTIEEWESQTDEYILDQNNKIIKLADENILDKLKEGEYIKISDLVQVKDSAFKQNRLIQGKDDERNNKELIPCTINIQINN